ncbi:MAG: SDR family NAD(P)-dependent oxidoreductase [Terriglobales bacterium]|jgi:3-oxoacyl-[acyl-carrier protein] reductase
MQLSLDSKVALITGGSRGIGAATVRLFAAAGAKVVFNYQSAKAQAAAMVRECGPANCRAVQCNLSTPKAAGELVSAAVAAFGRLDILVANHGIWPSEDAPVDRMTDEQWHRTIAVNLDSVFGLVKHTVGQIKKQRSQMSPQAKSGTSADAAGGNPADGSATGHIVLVSSTAGQRGEAFHCDYAASKGALISMVKGLSTELARDGIRVNCVAPGWVDTDMAAAALNDPPTRAKVFATIPLGRVGTVDEIAGPILFLCTPYAGFITGEIFNVNGGAVLVG